MATSGGKASFIDLEAGYGTFQVQYNPKEFKVDKAVSWKEHDDQGQTAAPLEFQKGAPMVVSMDLYFDTTNESGADVRDKWVNGLLCLTNAKVDPGEGLEKKRPPKVKFTWGSFSMTCVIESVNVTYLMFSSSGTPIRARCSVKLKEWGAEDSDAGSGGDYIVGDKVQLVTAGSGATASSVAAANNTTAKQVMSDNDIEDGTEIPAGTELVIRKPDSGDSNVTSNRSKKSSDSPFAEISDALKDAEKFAKEVSETKERIESLFGGGSSSKRDRGDSGGRGGRGGRSGGRSGGRGGGGSSSRPPRASSGGGGLGSTGKGGSSGRPPKGAGGKPSGAPGGGGSSGGPGGSSAPGGGGGGGGGKSGRPPKAAARAEREERSGGGGKSGRPPKAAARAEREERSGGGGKGGRSGRKPRSPADRG